MPSMQAARRCSCSHSYRRCSHSQIRDRHSHSHCCSTGKAHGSWTFYPSAKVVIISKTRLAKGEKSEREQPFGSPSVAFFKNFALRCPLLSEYDHAPEGKPHADARVRIRTAVVRIRKYETAIRTRTVVRPARHTASTWRVVLSI